MSLDGCRKQEEWEQTRAVDCSKVGCRQPGRHSRPWSTATLLLLLMMMMMVLTYLTCTV